MADEVVKTKRRICDVCHQGAPEREHVNRYVIRREGEGQCTVDLCNQHEVPIVKLCPALAGEVLPQRGRRRTRQRDVFKDPSQIPKE